MKSAERCIVPYLILLVLSPLACFAWSADSGVVFGIDALLVQDARFTPNVQLGGSGVGTLTVRIDEALSLVASAGVARFGPSSFVDGVAFRGYTALKAGAAWELAFPRASSTERVRAEGAARLGAEAWYGQQDPSSLYFFYTAFYAEPLVRLRFADREAVAFTVSAPLRYHGRRDARLVVSAGMSFGVEFRPRS